MKPLLAKPKLTRYKPNSAASRVGIVTITPTLMKSKNDSLKCLCLIVLLHITAFMADTGVSKDPIFDPITVAKTVKNKISLL